MKTLRLDGGRLALRPAPVETVISLEEWRAGARPEGGGFALFLPNDADISSLDLDLRSFTAVVLEFPAFRDGRAYTQARILRERFAFRGEIRARGDILRDQIDFMIRCGFDAFEIENADAEMFSSAIGEIGAVYQKGADDRAPAWRARAARAVAA